MRKSKKQMIEHNFDKLEGKSKRDIKDDLNFFLSLNKSKQEKFFQCEKRQKDRSWKIIQDEKLKDIEEERQHNLRR